MFAGFADAPLVRQVTVLHVTSFAVTKETAATINGGVTPVAAYTVNNTIHWWDGAVQGGVTTPGQTAASTLTYAANQHASSATITDANGAIRDVDFVTAQGGQMLKNFIFDVCKFKGNWSLGSFIDNTVAEVRKTVLAKPA